MIGERILDLRKDAGLTQDDLSAIINVNKHSISSYERNKSEPPDEIKIRIAKYFCTPLPVYELPVKGYSIVSLTGLLDTVRLFKKAACFRDVSVSIGTR